MARRVAGAASLRAPRRSPTTQLSGPWLRPQGRRPASPSTPRARHAKRARWSRSALVALLVVVVLVLVGTLQLARPLPVPLARTVLARSSTIPGVISPIPWPAQGQGAVAVPALGMVLASGAEQPVPVASLTKIMTAYIVLRDHPLAPGAQGPAVVINASDQTETYEEVDANDSSIPVQVGEVLSERQLLDGLLVHSANNFGDVLARWDAGSVGVFVAKMNAAAASLGMSETHYADSGGIDPRSVSTALDELRVATAAMSIPTFAAVVAQPKITLPVAGTLMNYVGQVGSDGVVGVKSGFTQAAMGCLVLAAQRRIGGHRVEVMAAVTGQPGLHPLDAAARATLPLIGATVVSLRSVPVTPRSRRVATVTTPWSSTVVAGTPTSTPSMVVWPGDTVRRSMRWAQLRGGAPAGTRLGTMEVTVGSERLEVPVRSESPIPGPSLLWRLWRF
ncbi:MAG: hypothetical protein ABSC00_03045 [Acidimicrobiales bacterium]